ncbi:MULTISPECIES: OmpA family protein [Niastella]|uniref:OmpA family protein n=1 Tax=Niastella soli TaxID=2821487 RepID=A0ABS3YWL2_9BACT|nr:OmpA family protein [Niastella soli]MBO9202324.1 OmpA family protein [Niastella soli]
MKKFYTLLLLTSTLHFAHAQMRVGILGGPQSSSVVEKNYIPDWENTTKPFYEKRGGLHVGLIGEIPLGYSNKVFFQPGVIFSNKGRKYQRYFDTTKVKTDTLFHSSTFYTNYIDMPLNIAVKLPLSKKTNFLISAGPYLSFFYGGKQNFETRDTNNRYKQDESSIQTGKNPNSVTTFDLGLNARIGFEIGNVLLTGFISQGLTNFYKASYDGTFKHKVIGASLGFWLNKRVILTNDQDHDGVPDKSDACPDVPGSAKAGGCPDKDDDGVADAVDKCPDVPGLPRDRGCPILDRDHDTVLDDVDQCPDVPGTFKYHGCPIPDTDGDGLNDETDLCPDKAGPIEFNGCPIPDTDGDGINDKEDKCPTVAGSIATKGCPDIKKEIVDRVNYAAKRIFFLTGSDKIANESYSALNSVVAILRNDTTMKLMIEGHTDNVGKPATNLLLSQKRADAVKNYLVQKGLDANRLEAKGYGQEKPVADNTTPEGKAANRRVELKLSQQ